MKSKSSLVIASVGLFAAMSVNAQVDMGQTQATGINVTATPVSTYQAPVTAGYAGSAAGTANRESGQQLIGSAVSVGVAGFMAVKCASPPSAAWACPAAALSALQATSLLANSGASRNSATSLSTGTTGATNSTTNNVGSTAVTGSGASSGASDSMGTTALSGQASGIQRDIAAVNSQLNGLGVQVAPDGSTVTLPNGRKVSAASFASPEAMSRAGFSDAQISEMQNAAAQAQAQAKVQDRIRGISMAVEGGAGGGAMGSPSESGRGGSLGQSGFHMPMLPRGAGGGERSKVSGLSKKLGSDNIGVAGDNIFEMIHVRYQKHDAENGFKRD